MTVFFQKYSARALVDLRTVVPYCVEVTEASQGPPPQPLRGTMITTARHLVLVITMIIICSAPASADPDKPVPSKEIVGMAKAVAEMACEARSREDHDQIPVVVHDGVTYIGSCIARSRSSEVIPFDSVRVAWDDYTNSCKDSPKYPVYFAGRCWPASFKVGKSCPGFTLVKGWRFYLLHGEWRTIRLDRCPSKK